MTDSELKYIQLERTMQFWRTRCRELKNGLRKIEGMAIASGDKNIEHVAHDTLNGVGKEV